MVHSTFCQFELKDINGKEITHQHKDSGDIVIECSKDINDQDIDSVWEKFKKIREHVKKGKLTFLAPNC